MTIAAFGYAKRPASSVVRRIPKRAAPAAVETLAAPRQDIRTIVANIKKNIHRSRRLPGLGDIDLSPFGIQEPADDPDTLTVDEVRLALAYDMDGMVGLGRAIADLDPLGVQQNRTLLLSVGEGIADPWMQGLAGTEHLGKSFFSKIGDFAKKVISKVGQVAAIAAPALAFIPGVGTAVAAAIGAGGSLISSWTGGGQQQADNAAYGPPLPSDAPGATAHSTTPWWNDFMDVANAAAGVYSAFKSKPATTVQQATPQSEPPATTPKDSTPSWLIPAALLGGVFLLSRR